MSIISFLKKIVLQIFIFLLFTSYSIKHSYNDKKYIGKKLVEFKKNSIKLNYSKLTSSLINSYIFYPNGDSTILFPFFKALAVKGLKSVRIAHFGDSNLEEGRISYELRNLLQKLFGGNSIGFVPLCESVSSIGYEVKSSKNWIRYNVFNQKEPNNIYGISGYSFKYISNTDTIETQFNKPPIISADAYLRIKVNTNYRGISIWYGYALSPCVVKIYDKNLNNLLYTGILNKVSSFEQHYIEDIVNIKELIFEFTGNSPVFYGISFEQKQGLTVDNFAIRGHSGNGLLLISKKDFFKQSQDLNVGMFIIQLGTNVIPYLYTDEICKNSALLYHKIYSHLKESCSQIPGIVIGVGDMARKEIINGTVTFVPYPNIENFIELQKKAALEAGYIFFDTYRWMGGKNSILKWYKEGMASYDGHFSSLGRQKLAEAIYNVIYNQYLLYLAQRPI